MAGTIWMIDLLGSSNIPTLQFLANNLIVQCRASKRAYVYIIIHTKCSACLQEVYFIQPGTKDQLCLGRKRQPIVNFFGARCKFAQVLLFLLIRHFANYFCAPNLLHILMLYTRMPEKRYSLLTWNKPSRFTSPQLLWNISPHSACA